MENKITIALVQSALHWENKNKNLEMFEYKLESIEEKSIVLLPEMFSTGFSMNPSSLAEGMDGTTVSWMQKMARAKRIIIGGSVIISENGLYYNRFIWMLPNGSCATYDKRHLFGYAGEQEKYSAGSRRQIVSVSGWRMNLIVCYDLRFPVWSRQVVKNGEAEYDVLLCVANWPEKRIYAWKTLLQARAIENQCFVAAVNRVGTDGNEIFYPGESMVVDPFGEIIDSRTTEEGILRVSLDRKHLEEVRSRFPFLKDADEFSIRSSES